MTMTQNAERYIALKRHLGIKYDTQGRIVRAYARYADGRGDDFVHSGAMVEWAAGSLTVDAARQRLENLRNFALWLRSEDKRHEVPPRDILGPRKRKRPTPHLLTCEQIGWVMEAALGLEPMDSITPHTFHFMIGLVASTGLRATEAATLRLSDITADGLVIRVTKFRKTRLVVLHRSVREALERYVEIRKKTGGSEDCLFVLSTGRPVSSNYLSNIFAKLARRVGVKDGPGKPGPTLHSLRHSFAVRSLEAVKATDRDKVSRHMIALSTYLGHAHVASTYWYLEGTPALLRSIADATENAHKWRAAQ